MIGLGSAAALVLVIVLIATNTGGGSSSDAHSEASPTVERPSLDVALDTVCKAGSFNNGRKLLLLNASSGGTCVSDSGHDPITIGTYPSSGSYDLKTDVNRGTVGYYAVGELDDGQTIVFATVSRSSPATPLEPLTSLGFEIREGGS